MNKNRNLLKAKKRKADEFYTSCEDVENELKHYTEHFKGKKNFIGGDFRSEESRRLLEEADLVVTNPPFSLFREYFDLLTDQGKQFLIIGNMNAVTYKNVFPYIKENKV